MSRATELIAQLPWVTRLDETQDCDGYRYGHMPLKALYDPALRVKYKCKARARWKFTALPPDLPRDPMAARSGTYCWQHLFTQILGYPPEEQRFKRTMARLRERQEQRS